MNRDLKELEDKIGVHFRSLEFLKTALTHRSYLNEHPKFTKEHNERLEFLGDSILEFVISEYLFRNLQKSEGEMTNIRAALVNAETLSLPK